jgi:hypothetical protein
MTPETSPEHGRPEDGRQAYLAAQKKRNLYIGGALLLFVVLVFFVTMIQMSRNTQAERDKAAQGRAAAASTASR